MATLLLIGDPSGNPNGGPSLDLLDSPEPAVCGTTRLSAIAHLTNGASAAPA